MIIEIIPKLGASCGRLGFSGRPSDSCSLKENMKSHNAQSWEVSLGTADVLSDI